MTDLSTLIKLIHDLRDSILEVEGDVEYRCAAAANILCRILPEAEHMKGSYGGEQHHWAAMEVEGEVIVLDATVGQFPDAPDVFVGISIPEYNGASYGNTQIESGVNEEAILKALSTRGWVIA